MARGDRYCQKCGKYLGNYMTGEFYSLIRKKYCDECKIDAYSDFHTLRQRKNRADKSEIIKLQREQIELLKAENAALRRMLDKK